MTAFSGKILLVEGEGLLTLAEYMVDLLIARQFSAKPKPDITYLTPAALHKAILYSEEKIRRAIQAGKYGRVDTSSKRPRFYATVTEAREYHFAKSEGNRKIIGQKKDPYS